MEFRIADVTEKFRTLQMYKQSVEEEILHDALSLEKNWKDLERLAKKKEHQLAETKREYAAVTLSQVAEF
jgi:dynein heavy chain